MLGVALCLALLLAGARVWSVGAGFADIASAQGPAGYEIAWYTIDGGGATFSSGGSYSLGGTAGQADAGGQLSGGTYTLTGGFWQGASSSVNTYLPLVRKG
jgi:hypothetical protein